MLPNICLDGKVQGTAGRGPLAEGRASPVTGLPSGQWLCEQHWGHGDSSLSRGRWGGKSESRKLFEKLWLHRGVFVFS